MNLSKSFFIFYSLFLFSSAQAEVNQYFDQIKTDPNALYAFFKAMPKGGELHYHLAGGPYPETMIQIASQGNYCLNKTSLATRKFTTHCDGININELFKDPDLYSKVIKNWSMKDFISGEESGHDHFFKGFDKYMPIVSNNKALLITDIIKRAAQQEEQYLEILDIPDNGNSLGFAKLIQNAHSLNDKKQLLLNNKDFQTNIDFAISESELILKQAREKLSCAQNPKSSPCQITIKFLYFALREQPLDAVFAQALSAFEAVSRTKGSLVGVNLVQPEDGIISSRDYHKQMLIFNFLHQQYPKVPISLHAGELTFGSTPEELSFHIKEALRIGKASRIGHGVDIALETHSESSLNYMSKNQIPVEINLISNLKILNVSGKQHPLNYYLSHKVPVVLSTDDEGVLRTDLTQQYVEATYVHHLNYEQIKQINRNALTFAFLPGKSIWAKANTNELIAECQNLNSDSCKTFIKNNEKAFLQWRLEQKLIDFEDKW